jgi:hypothetical protein
MTLTPAQYVRQQLPRPAKANQYELDLLDAQEKALLAKHRSMITDNMDYDERMDVMRVLVQEHLERPQQEKHLKAPTLEKIQFATPAPKKPKELLFPHTPNPGGARSFFPQTPMTHSSSSTLFPQTPSFQATPLISTGGVSLPSVVFPGFESADTHGLGPQTNVLLSPRFGLGPPTPARSVESVEHQGTTWAKPNKRSRKRSRSSSSKRHHHHHCRRSKKTQRVKVKADPELDSSDLDSCSQESRSGSSSSSDDTEDMDTRTMMRRLLDQENRIARLEEQLEEQEALKSEIHSVKQSMARIGAGPNPNRKGGQNRYTEARKKILIAAWEEQIDNGNVSPGGRPLVPDDSEVTRLSIETGLTEALTRKWWSNRAYFPRKQAMRKDKRQEELYESLV